MKTQVENTPAIVTPTLIAEARAALPGDWLEKHLATASSHWRIYNKEALNQADATLRALFLVAYRKALEPVPNRYDGGPIDWINLSAIQANTLPSLRQSTDQSYGDGFYAEARAHSKTLVERNPTSDPTALLSGLSEFLRFEVPSLTSQRGTATRALEAIWEQMNIGWYN